MDWIGSDNFFVSVCNEMIIHVSLFVVIVVFAYSRHVLCEVVQEEDGNCCDFS
jgi:hypothetical protein